MSILRPGRYVLALLVVGVLVVASVSLASANDPSPADRAVVNLGNPMGDAELIAFLDQYQVMPTTAYLATAHFNGTHRARSPQNVGRLIQQARVESIESFNNSLHGSVMQSMQHFVEMHTEVEVAASEDLQAEARALLNLRAGLEVALADVQGNAPIVYAVEVAGPKDHLDRLRSDERVSGFDRVLESADNGSGSRPMPGFEIEPYRDPAVQSMSVRELYQHIQSLVGTAR